MSGRHIRRPPARIAAQEAATAHTGERPASRSAKPRGGAKAVGPRVLAAGLAILAAGTAATFFLERTVLTPRSQVQAQSALPVYSAVGQRTDDVSFWPWSFYAEQAGQAPTVTPVEDMDYVGEQLSLLTTALLGGTVEVETDGLALESYSTNLASCTYLRGAPLVWTPSEGNAQPLTLDLGLGGGSDPALSLGMALSLVVKPEHAPTEAQLEAAYRQVLLELYFQCGAALWLLNNGAGFEQVEATPAPADAGEAAASEPPAPETGAFSDETIRRIDKAASLPLDALMDRMRGPLAEEMFLDENALQWPAGFGPDTGLWPLEGSPSPVALAEGTLGENDTRRLEQQLQQQYAEYGMELQVVTLSDSVLALFSDGGITLGFYYDPVLDVWSGVAVQ